MTEQIENGRKMEYFDVNMDIENIIATTELYDLCDIFNVLIQNYINENRLRPDNYSEIGQLWAACVDCVRSTYDE